MVIPEARLLTLGLVSDIKTSTQLYKSKNIKHRNNTKEELFEVQYCHFLSRCIVIFVVVVIAHSSSDLLLFNIEDPKFLSIQNGGENCKKKKKKIKIWINMFNNFILQLKIKSIQNFAFRSKRYIERYR